MNVEEANAIPLSEILAKLGHFPVKEKNDEQWYNSPLRNEKNASFHLKKSKNIWYDFGEAKGGRTIDFVCAYLEAHNEDHTVVDALRWLENMHVHAAATLFSHDDAGETSLTLHIRKVAPVQNATLIRYLKSRDIPLVLAKKYLKEIYIHNKNTGKNFYALGMKNENHGYELRNKFFKGCIALKTISFFRGSTILPDDVHVFEGVFDFLSALVYHEQKIMYGDVIILNSLSCLPHAFPYIKGYTYKTVFSWLDNDAAGNKATEVLKAFGETAANVAFDAMNRIYAPHKDVNAWHVQNPGKQAGLTLKDHKCKIPPRTKT